MKTYRQPFTFALGIPQRTDADLKQTEVAPIGAMKLGEPVLCLGKCRDNVSGRGVISEAA